MVARTMGSMMPVAVGIASRPTTEAQAQAGWLNRDFLSATLGVAAASLLTAGLAAAMALDLQGSFSSERVERVARRERLGVVTVASGAIPDAAAGRTL